jgi:hypothetical protein
MTALCLSWNGRFERTGCTCGAAGQLFAAQLEQLAALETVIAQHRPALAQLLAE